jgi:hypothetical protein
MAQEPMRVADIHEACEQLLGGEMLYGSVKNWLSDGWRRGVVTRGA